VLATALESVGVVMGKLSGLRLALESVGVAMGMATVSALCWASESVGVRAMGKVSGLCWALELVGAKAMRSSTPWDWMWL
jgi:hypothetical protein